MLLGATVVRNLKPDNSIVYVFSILLVLAVVVAFGCRGQQGPSGELGAKGDAGAPATPPSIAITPISPSTTCPNGGSLITIGTANSVVCNGNQGSPGLNGMPGVDATPTTIIQLCPGMTTYPTTFVEVAICANDELYAVYSYNNGFLTLLPPGDYISNAVGSNCNFHVGSHCTVTR